jgi:FtsP/CotA-like multicopper oxidase with cupredoxin domain
VHPGDHLILTVKNELPASNGSMQMDMPPVAHSNGKGHDGCGMSDMTAASVNVHFHGTNVPPTCHQDEVIKTLINPGQTFTYDVDFPLDEPPGLYWYHPHVHGISEAVLQGGASGAIVVEGIEKVNHAVAGLPERVIIIRDGLVPAAVQAATNLTPPSYDLSVNYTPVPFPSYPPVVIPMLPHGKQFWRVLNASADAIMDLQLQFDGVAQNLEIVAFDGVPTGSHDGTGIGRSIWAKHIPLPPAGRVEFIVDAPPASVAKAQLTTRDIDTGPDGDDDPQRPLASIRLQRDWATSEKPPLLPLETEALPPAQRMRFDGLADTFAVTQRKLYFSEVLTDPSDPNSPTNFYITVDGQKPVLFSPDNPPAIVTTQGSVEDWTVENRALEVHEFHIHQIHFKVMERNGTPVDDGQYYDTIQVPYWSGTGPYPSLKLRMDFRGQVTGDFVYHCHILGHEDSGMMAIIRVKPKTN